MTPNPTQLDVPLALQERWSALAPGIRDHVGSYLADTADAPAPVATVDQRQAPGTFADDLARGARRLRAAFPGLIRRLVAIEADDDLRLRIACEGSHDAPFYGLMNPTGRRVRFEEIHVVSARDGAVAEDRVSIDLRAIVRQLGRAPAR